MYIVLASMTTGKDAPTGPAERLHDFPAAQPLEAHSDQGDSDG